MVCWWKKKICKEKAYCFILGLLAIDSEMEIRMLKVHGAFLRGAASKQDKANSGGRVWIAAITAVDTESHRSSLLKWGVHSFVPLWDTKPGPLCSLFRSLYLSMTSYWWWVAQWETLIWGSEGSSGRLNKPSAVSSRQHSPEWGHGSIAWLLVHLVF